MARDELTVAGGYDVGMSLERIRAVGDATSEALALSDPEGIVLVVNPAYCALYGRPADAFVGHSFARIFPETDQAMALDQYCAVFAAPDPPQSNAARIQRTGHPLRIEFPDGPIVGQWDPDRLG